MQVLVLSDQRETESLWIHCLEQRSLRAIAAKISADSKQIGTSSLEACELMVLDIQAYGECALALCRSARTRFDGPILLFTYEDDERFHLEAYRAGADESITKPIGIALAVSKVLAWLRRISQSLTQSSEGSHQNGHHSLVNHDAWPRVEKFQMDTMQRLVTTPEGKVTKLSKLEYRLLEFFAENPGTILAPYQLLDEVWMGNPSMSPTRLKNLVYRLRKKIEPDPDVPCYLCTIPGFGYSFKAEIGNI